MPKTQRRPDPPPLATNDRPVVLVGIALWAVAFVVLVGIALWAVAFVVLVVFFRHDLHRHHATYWIWSCGIGVAMGLYGLHFIKQRSIKKRRGQL